MTKYPKKNSEKDRVSTSMQQNQEKITVYTEHNDIQYKTRSLIDQERYWCLCIMVKSTTIYKAYKILTTFYEFLVFLTQLQKSLRLLLYCIIFLWALNIHVCNPWLWQSSAKTCESKQEIVLSTALFWAITQRVLVIPYRRFGTTFDLILKCQELDSFLDSWHLKM